MRRIRRLVSSVLRRRMRYSVTIAALTVVSVLVLLWARAAGETFSGDLLMNLGATVAGAVVTAMVLQPLIERAQTPEVVVHMTFPHARFLDAMSDTASRIKIMGAWPYGMDPAHRRTFLEVLHRAVDARVPVQILVLDPSSPVFRTCVRRDSYAISCSDRVGVIAICSGGSGTVRGCVGR
ncbi:hypothetical protein, partial [Parafrankia sp. FMc2]|uniref:hypothetical protein n=1 Tax=Parafrankia sp. FMc2 TaxID=3233196 RepID=UPI0034D71D32